MIRRPWTPDEVAYLVAAYQDTSTAAIAASLGRTDRQVYCKATALGLKKSAAYLAGPYACRLRRGDSVGAAHRFQPGQKPWNAGLKGYQAGGRSAETRFKPGRTSPAHQGWISSGVDVEREGRLAPATLVQP